MTHALDVLRELWAAEPLLCVAAAAAALAVLVGAARATARGEPADRGSDF